MVDTNDLVRQWLLGTSSVTSLLSGSNPNGSIYATPDLPQHVDIKAGPAIQIFNMDGKFDGEIAPLLDDRKCIKVWADVGKNRLAKQIYGAIFDLMHGATMIDFGSDGRIIRAWFSSGPQEVTDPDDGFITVIGFVQVMAIQTSTSGTFVDVIEGGSF